MKALALSLVLPAAARLRARKHLEATGWACIRERRSNAKPTSSTHTRAQASLTPEPFDNCLETLLIRSAYQNH